MKNRMLILAVTIMLGACQMQAAPQKKNSPKQSNNKYTKEAKSRLSAKQKKELTDAIMSYRGSLAAIRIKEAAGNNASDADVKNRSIHKKVIDKYNRNYSNDPFVVSEMTRLNDRLTTETRPQLPAKGQDYYGKLTPPALPAKNEDYYSKLTPSALPARNPNYSQFIKTYNNQIILPNNEINKDWIVRGSQAVRSDLGAQATKATVQEELWRLAQDTINDSANSPLNANNPSYRQDIKNSFDAAFDDFWKS